MIEYNVKVYDNRTEWWLNGNRHREDGPAIECSNGDKFWYLNGNCHREDGPAIERANGYKAWYLNGQRHREDGTAIVYTNGNQEWYLNNNQYPREEYYKELYKRGILPKEQCFLELI